MCLLVGFVFEILTGRFQILREVILKRCAALVQFIAVITFKNAEDLSGMLGQNFF